MIWRPLKEFYDALGLKPSVATHLPTSKARRLGKPWMAPRLFARAARGAASRLPGRRMLGCRMLGL
jgi:hypothetical protein